MAAIRITHFTVDPANVDEMVARRAALITALRASYPGLTETRLARVDEQTWVDIWRWDSADDLATANSAVAAGAVPEAPAAFAFVANATDEQAEVVDER